ncbi:hypothetical protein [Priestia taiwanensis]|uniref:Phage protein n=1 Tax=Priestia taiwanensis TaxID=1347902 RepID=A0A917AL05_9BACI|nr:hypothetical protein [Priestia taiwanensis]MBM7361997.1 transcription initiation factor TFIIIB Brf1 subunit/transcription initiation factor TFIIB [Priestia taiwanensis]GGE58635.1 hypothetical protein GCM10007140_06220 [Priestia taiwanensis]
MARLSDLVNVNINRNVIKVQGAEIPVIFTMESFAHIEEAYGKKYHVFEKDLHKTMTKKNIVMGKSETKIMYALIYAMIRTAGTECTLEEIKGAIPLNDVPGIFQATLDIFNNQNFQQSDMEKIKKEKK